MHSVCVSLRHSCYLSVAIRSSVLTNASHSFSPISAARLGLRDGGSAGVPASLKADEILNTWPEAQVRRVLGDYCDVRRWKHTVRKTVQARLTGGIDTTSGREDVIRRSSFTRSGKKETLKPGMHPATQSLPGPRLAVNDELKTLQVAISDEVALSDALSLSPGGRQQNLVPFVKYHGLGNDFILVDNRHSSTLCITPEQAAKLCDRNFGVGGDGVIFVLPGVNGSDYAMRIINSDGSEPEMCGNGIRCMAKFIADLENITEPRSYKIDTLAGLIIPELMEDGQVCVDMGPPILEAKKVPTTLEPTCDSAVVKAPLVVAGRSWSVTCVSMGNPHCVVLLDDSEDVYSLPLSEIGPFFEKNEVFPARTNTEFVQVLSPSHLRMRVWERGAGPTLACGTGACALVVAAVLEGRAERNCLVELPGGPLGIDWRESDNHVYMTGPAEIVFRGTAYV